MGSGASVPKREPNPHPIGSVAWTFFYAKQFQCRHPMPLEFLFQHEGEPIEREHGPCYLIFKIHLIISIK